MNSHKKFKQDITDPFLKDIDVYDKLNSIFSLLKYKERLLLYVFSSDDSNKVIRDKLQKIIVLKSATSS